MVFNIYHLFISIDQLASHSVIIEMQLNSSKKYDKILGRECWMLLPMEGRLVDFGASFCTAGLDLLFAFAYLRYDSYFLCKSNVQMKGRAKTVTKSNNVRQRAGCGMEHMLRCASF